MEDKIGSIKKGKYADFVILNQNPFTIPKSEIKNIEGIRRSVVASRDLKSGTILKVSDVTCKRPGTGISPPDIELLVGRTIKSDLSEDEPITWDHIS